MGCVEVAIEGAFIEVIALGNRVQVGGQEWNDLLRGYVLYKDVVVPLGCQPARQQSAELETQKSCHCALKRLLGLLC
jgi:hypothetical protein